MTRTRWGLLILGLVAVGFVGGGSLLVWSCAKGVGLLPGSHSSASTRQARAEIEQILFLQGDRVLLRNQRGELFVSTGDAEAWEKLDDRIFDLAVANENEIWGAYGTLSEYSLKPGGTIWHSRDGGISWQETELSFPSEFSCNRRMTYSDSELSRLPMQFIQEPSDPPLLLMFNLQLMRPKAGRDVDAWDRVGARIPAPNAHHNGEASGLQHDGTIYVAANHRIYMSTDQANTWSSTKVHDFLNSRIRCRKDRCYAVLSELRSGWEGIFTTLSGSNDWTELGSLSVAALADALGSQAEKFGAIEEFAAKAILPTTNGVYVAGYVNGLLSPAWGALLFLSDAGELRALAGAPDGLLELAQSPDGSLWAGSTGAHQWTERGWRQVWRYPADTAVH